MAAIWDALIDCICRPPRDAYDPRALLGGEDGMLTEDACRIDFVVENKKGQKLQCSQYMPLDVKTADGRLPVVVYCHCNSGSKRDADEAVVHLLPAGISVVAFDFSGSGLSDGDWVTLGANEVDDLEAVIQHLRAQGGVSSVGLWGRSMGAVTALMYSARDPTIAGMVLDSPFSRLTDLMLEIVVQQRLPIPRMMLKFVLRMMRTSVRKKAGFDINDVAPIDLVARSVIPAVFGHGVDDTFINISHSEKLQAAYGGEYRNLVRFEGDHNHRRPQFFYDSVVIFFHQQLQLEQVLVGKAALDQQLARQISAALADAEGRGQGGTHQPWQVQDLPDLAQSNAAEAALEAAVASGELATKEDCAAAAAATTSTAAAAAAAAAAAGATPGAPAPAGGWAVDPAAQVRSVASSRSGGSAAHHALQGQQDAARPSVGGQQQLAAAVAAASLERPPETQPRGGGGGGDAAAGAAAAAAAAGEGVSAQATARPSQRAAAAAAAAAAAPRTAEEEEEMLQRALALSLADQPQQQQQGDGRSAAAGVASSAAPAAVQQADAPDASAAVTATPTAGGLERKAAALLQQQQQQQSAWRPVPTPGPASGAVGEGASPGAAPTPSA